MQYIRRKQDSECFNGEELERKILRNYCQCTEMDYECDIGYIRNEQGMCQQIPEYTTRLGDIIKQDQAAQCESFGFYTTT